MLILGLPQAFHPVIQHLSGANWAGFLGRTLGILYYLSEYLHEFWITLVSDSHTMACLLVMSLPKATTFWTFFPHFYSGCPEQDLPILPSCLPHTACVYSNNTFSSLWQFCGCDLMHSWHNGSAFPFQCLRLQ